MTTDCSKFHLCCKGTGEVAMMKLDGGKGPIAEPSVTKTNHRPVQGNSGDKSEDPDMKPARHYFSGDDDVG